MYFAMRCRCQLSLTRFTRPHNEAAYGVDTKGPKSTKGERTVNMSRDRLCDLVFTHPTWHYLRVQMVQRDQKLVRG